VSSPAVFACFQPLVVYAEEFRGFGYVFRSPDTVAHDIRETDRLWLCPAIPDQLVVECFQEPEAGYPVVVDVTDLRPSNL
jgi:hypothetical protein